MLWFYLDAIGLIDLRADVGMCFVQDTGVRITNLRILLKLEGA